VNLRLELRRLRGAVLRGGVGVALLHETPRERTRGEQRADTGGDLPADPTATTAGGWRFIGGRHSRRGALRQLTELPGRACWRLRPRRRSEALGRGALRRHPGRRTLRRG